MTTRITEETFEEVVLKFEDAQEIDFRKAAFVDPYGMVGLLGLGDHYKSADVQKTIFLPESEEVLKYLERMDFFKFARVYFDLKPPSPHMPEKYLRSSESDVLLEITPIEKSDDIHFIVRRVKKRSHTILARHLNYDENAISSFIVALSEVCQNIIEHSGYKGFVGIQKYHFQNMNKNVVKIAVMDIGIGFKKSLSERFSQERLRGYRKGAPPRSIAICRQR